MTNIDIDAPVESSAERIRNYERAWRARDLREAVLSMAERYADSVAELTTGERPSWSRLRGKAETSDAQVRAAHRRYRALARLSESLANMAGADM